MKTTEIDETTTCTLSFLRDALGVSQARVSQLAAEGVIKKAGHDGYYLHASVQGYLSHTFPDSLTYWKDQAQGARER